MIAQKTQCPLAGGQSAKENTNVATVPPAQKTGNNFAILKAKFALAGHKLQRVFMTTGETVYIVSRWSMSRVFVDFRDLESFLEKVTGIKS